METEIEKSVVEGNKIIGIFDGIKIEELLNGDMFVKYQNGACFRCVKENLDEMLNLKYHSDWNWLHSVIDKIKIVHSGLDANEVRIILFELTVVEDIRTVWLSVLTYIKWYNLYITELVEDFKKHGLP